MHWSWGCGHDPQVPDLSEVLQEPWLQWCVLCHQIHDFFQCCQKWYTGRENNRQFVCVIVFFNGLCELRLVDINIANVNMRQFYAYLLILISRAACWIVAEWDIPFTIYLINEHHEWETCEPSYFDSFCCGCCFCIEFGVYKFQWRYKEEVGLYIACWPSGSVQCTGLWPVWEDVCLCP